MLKISSNANKNKPAWVKWLNAVLQHGDRPWNGLLIGMALLALVLILLIGLLLWNESSQARALTGLQFLIPTNDAN